MADAYNRVRYIGFPMAQTHPDRLAVIARLFGLAASPPGECRVLELGCADGGNIIPMALALPRSRFTGFDSAAQAVAQGRALVAALGLNNITLLERDLMEAGAELGEFDYIIAHGVYSWVPEDARERLLHICRDNLAPQGVAYVSYNALPGFHRREMFRQMLLFHLAGVEDPADRVRQAIAFIESLGQSASSPLARALFAEETQHLTQSHWWYVYHDDLEPVNYAPYFHEFLAQARAHGLQYLGEAHFPEVESGLYNKPAVEKLRQWAQGDALRTEQYIDFVRGRLFRQTLLCRAEVALWPSPHPDPLTAMYFASAVSPVSPVPDLSPGVWEEFRAPHGAPLRSDDPQVKTALARLHAVWPQFMPFAELLAQAGGEPALLADFLLHTYGAELVEVSVRPDPSPLRPGERPVASPLARLQAKDGTLVTTLRHAQVDLADHIDRCLVQWLDGTRDRPALAAALHAFLESNPVAGAQPVTPESLEMRLDRLARQALLVA